jgi:ketosteroid isomerase-like protein
VKHLWFHGFLAGLGAVIIISLALLFLKGTPTPPAPKEREVTAVPSLTPPTQVAPGQPGTGQTTPPVGFAGSNAVLKVQLEEVLANLREANLKKDLTRFLNVYSPAFPQREKKGQDISKVWDAYDYLAMGFRIDEVKPLGVDRAYARVTWNIKTQDRNTKKLKDVTRTYQVWFAKESDQWRIRALDKGK